MQIASAAHVCRRYFIICFDSLEGSCGQPTLSMGSGFFTQFTRPGGAHVRNITLSNVRRVQTILHIHNSDSLSLLPLHCSFCYVILHRESILIQQSDITE
jgi:hypothetical protein